MAGKVCAVAKFISQKVSTVSWEPENTVGVLKCPSLLATGSWDDPVNKVSLWSAAEDGSSESIADDSYNQTTLFDAEPELVCDAVHVGDVTDLLFLSSDAILASSSTGAVSLYRHQSHTVESLNIVQSWPDIHSFSGSQSSDCSCTALANQNNEFASVGQDGRLNVVNLERPDQIETIGSTADSCTLNDVCYIQQRCIAVINSIGQFKVWDLRLTSDKPSKVLVLSEFRVPMHCMTQHPTQPHILATGGQDGMLYLWDMRQEKLPITVNKAHSSDMWDVQFHPSHPDHLFTCSNDGSLWHWDNSKASAQVASMVLLNKGNVGRSQVSQQQPVTGDWTMTSHRQLEIKDLVNGANTMSVNCLDVTGNRLVCGTDSEQIILVQNLGIF